MSKNKKKQKPYYKVMTTNNKIEKESKALDLTKNTTFMLGVGFILLMYSKYVSNNLFSRLTAILGLLIMLFGIYSSIKNNRIKENKNKINYIIDYGALILIVATLLFNIYILIMKNI
ncbi:hypothetical protein [Peptostreptococcus sp. D1]|uniref:hypothetical protein n=1 Tax=Peptostreptococcus sp. D1 TaxID=72304 RepID=UPI0008E662D9|nr:hypothetical protein [Peptostreptococcus sp. D1]SFE41837.1 hypothetical protein SAMN02910278_00773 [Peptostreptococcus sp. D1]